MYGKTNACKFGFFLCTGKQIPVRKILKLTLNPFFRFIFPTFNLCRIRPPQPTGRPGSPGHIPPHRVEPRGAGQDPPPGRLQQGRRRIHRGDDELHHHHHQSKVGPNRVSPYLFLFFFFFFFTFFDGLIGRRRLN